MPARKGRGAVGNAEGRFEKRRMRPEDYGWDAGGDEDAPPRLATTVIPEKTCTILSRNDSPDIPFDRSINPYKGCEHGCVYCLARPIRISGCRPASTSRRRSSPSRRRPACCARSCGAPAIAAR